MSAIKQVGEYWVDDKNNKWEVAKFPKEIAKANSYSLIDCFECVNCNNCVMCNGCVDCEMCYYCEECSVCGFCKYCRKLCMCSHCQYCIGGINNMYCSSCNYCYNCNECVDCTSCWNVVNGNALLFETWDKKGKSNDKSKRSSASTDASNEHLGENE